MNSLKTSTVCVIGSINMDLAVSTHKMPAQGETVIDGRFTTHYGGKGANQAVAAARMGVNVNMLGAVGGDAFGIDILKHLRTEGISTDGIEIISDKATGIANIILSERNNRIIVASGANLSVTPELIDRYQTVIKHSDMILLQLEIPMEAITHTLALADEYDVPVILNPAPYQTLPGVVSKGVTYITPNEIELGAIKLETDYETIKQKLIVTKGEHGVQYYEDSKVKSLPTYQVDVMDTTGAGDTFNGVLAAMLAEQKTVSTAVDYANAAAGLSVTKVGAQGGMPTYEELKRFLHDRRDDP